MTLGALQVGKHSKASVHCFATLLAAPLDTKPAPLLHEKSWITAKGPISDTDQEYCVHRSRPMPTNVWSGRR